MTRIKLCEPKNATKEYWEVVGVVIALMLLITLLGLHADSFMM